MKKVVIIFFILWILIAFFNVLYNSNKTVAEIKEWAFLSDSEKRHKIFGDLYDFFIRVNDYTEKDAQILVYSHHEMTSGVGRYYIYPRFLVWPRDEKKFNTLAKEKSFKYIFSYNSILEVDAYEQIASFSAKEDSTNYAVLYRRK